MFTKFRSLVRGTLLISLVGAGGFTGQWLEQHVNYELGLTTKLAGLLLASVYGFMLMPKQDC